MRWVLLSLLVIPLLEIFIFIWAGGKIGAWWVVGLILITGVVGIAAVKQQGAETLQRARANMERGQPPTMELIDGLCILLGAVFLITPGFLTDTIGFILVLPWTRRLFKKKLQHLIAHIFQRGVFIYRRW